MATTPTQVRIDADIKAAATELFSNLGLDMSGAVNLFLHQCVLRGGLPFAVELPNYSAKTLEAMAEARRISSDSSLKGYTDMDALKAALEED
ncbi:MAG: type II toxin-antitoxin system RelB/DinJ family antitoxin [Clostridia bacterium]|nr:type II toxin-antitoxin system RelB/DinJ family antitoxin [Clostridia bacterium]